jgi:hypothetical protein
VSITQLSQVAIFFSNTRNAIFFRIVFGTLWREGIAALPDLFE